MKLLTLDVETTMNAPGDLDKAHPMHPDNYIVLLGTRITGQSGSQCYGPELWENNLYEQLYNNDFDFIVGCNISFDLLYMYPASLRIKHQLQSKRLWDIQIAEYLLTAQQSKYPSLDSMSVKYGLPVKDAAVTSYFDKGIGSDRIPLDLLREYLARDVINTEQIALKQIEQATESGQLNLIISQMEALHCTTEMMFNGLNIDMDYYKNYAAEVAVTFADNEQKLKDSVATVVLDETLYPLDDVASPTQWSKLLFGGTKKVDTKEVVGLYKNGKVKTKKVTTEVKTSAFCDITPLDEWKSEKTGKVSVDEKVLTVIEKETKNKEVKEVVSTLLKHRDLTKQLTTYIQGLSKHVIYHKDEDAYSIHGRLNHVTTSTGRLSSSSPNLQNISNNPIKKVFTSRWGAQGCLIEFDFQQLEVAVLAHLTKDPQLIEDISTGKDIHTELYKDMFHVEPTKEERKWFKRLTFGLIYGAGAKTLADNAGCTLDVSKGFMEAFYNRYPGVQAWNEEIQIKASLDGMHYVADSGYELIKTWLHKSETSRIYCFKQYKNKYADSAYSSRPEYGYSPTELKNYPVQGLATGDIVPMMLGVLFRKFKDTVGLKLVNTVHDSILLDVVGNEENINKIIKEVTDVLNNTHLFYEKTFEKPLALKLSAGCSVGKNWFEMKERTI